MAFGLHSDIAPRFERSKRFAACDKHSRPAAGGAVGILSAISNQTRAKKPAFGGLEGLRGGRREVGVEENGKNR
jgi:hypothetical protein